MGKDHIFSAHMSRKQALDALRKSLNTVNIPSASLDARLLLAHALGVTQAELMAHDDLALGDSAPVILDILTRRLNGESVARIIGTREFWGLSFRLSPDTLEPRPDTETLVEAILAACPDRQAPSRLLDLGTGTGCILIAILSELPNATGIGVDIHQGAQAMAAENAALNKVSGRADFLVSNWFEKVEGHFDIIISNPPYIRSQIIGELDREVRDFDPTRALDGGADGLDAYRHILSQAPPFLKPGGQIGLEIGYDQQQDLEILGTEAGFREITCRRDLAGHPRVIMLAGLVR